MKWQTSLVFYFHFDDHQPDVAGPPIEDVLHRLHADNIEPLYDVVHAAHWAGLAIEASLSPAPTGEHRLLVQFDAAAWEAMSELTDGSTRRWPGQYRRLVTAFAAACEALGASIAFKDSLVFYDKPLDELPYEEFDGYRSLESAFDLLRTPIQFGYVRDGLDGIDIELNPRTGWAFGMTEALKTDGGTVWFRDDMPSFRWLADWPADRVFSAPAALGWEHRWWGFWDHVDWMRTGVEQFTSSFDDYTDETVPQQVRDLLADYLDGGFDVVAWQEPPMRCALCQQRVANDNIIRTDDEWLWPSFLSHHVREHHFVLPNNFAEKILGLHGATPQFMGKVPVAELPWPPHINTEEGLWPHEVLAQGNPNAGWRVFHPDGTVNDL